MTNICSKNRLSNLSTIQIVSRKAIVAYPAEERKKYQLTLIYKYIMYNVLYIKCQQIDQHSF